ncbi:MAG: hypothetical protein OQK77_05930 [Psychromonas sp.]|nr:hypothetical protein [Psychromonas sp.]
MISIYLGTVLLKDFLPKIAPIMALITDKIHPLHINIHIDVIQKLGSTNAEIIPPTLQSIGTYQTLEGSFLQMKKHTVAIAIA